MALLWMDGFDSYGTSVGDAPSPTHVVARKYASVMGESGCKVQGGHVSGYSLELGSYAYLSTPALTTDSTLVVGFAFQFATAADNALFLAFFDGGTPNLYVATTAAGEIEVIGGDSTILGTTSGLGLQTGTWYYITLKATCNATTGSFSLYLGTTLVLSVSNVQTKFGTNDYFDTVMLADGGLQPRFDDFYCLDSSGSVNNDVLGVMKVATLRPAGAGASTQWTPDSGSNYARVNEVVCDDDASYVEQSVSGDWDSYTYDSLPGGVSTIAGIVVWTDCKPSEYPISLTLKSSCRSGATESDSPAQAFGPPYFSYDYGTLGRVLETDPNTSPAAAWSVDSLNAAQFGVKVG